VHADGIQGYNKPLEKKAMQYLMKGEDFAMVRDVFGSDVFSEAVMAERLPKNVFNIIRKVIYEGKPLEASTADVVANAMKDWAIERGATHYCHWFQPMTGMTAEKHDAFISPTRDGRTVMEFTGKELIQGEPDASSFPSGGLRATFEARGYTAWDCTSPVFVKRDGKNTTLFIPCAFCSYTSEALDKKTPLLRSMEAMNRAALRVLRCLGNTTAKSVMATLGAEQEYFLVDRDFFAKRLDLSLVGRTLFGAPAPKGQEMEDQYFGTLHDRVGTFMHELNQELWRLGISAKTQHREVAPGQYEIAPIFTTANVATDWNQLMMETLQNVALRHGFACLLHEKPFAGVNGSGKHNNWSMGTDDGLNLLEPGNTPHDNMVFMVFLCAIVRAVDKYASLLRATVASAGNDHRLGANEAPPAIVSIFLGEQLTDIFEQMANGKADHSKQKDNIELGVSSLPSLPKDSTDRNRTSPFAFTGNKFEFRMCGSALSTSGPTFIFNTSVAEVLSEMADELEKSKDVEKAAQKIIQRIAKEHKRIIFNGDNYTEEWREEAEKRGLPNLANTVEALATVMSDENVKLFEGQGVLTKMELAARTEILYEIYTKAINIEARTMLDMGRRDILGAAHRWAGRLARTARALDGSGHASDSVTKNLQTATKLCDALDVSLEKLEDVINEASRGGNAEAQAIAFCEKVLPVMEETREVADNLEQIMDAELWPLPTYSEMLFLR